MANLTGDFDVIAQFAVPAIDRILAAMHAVERFPHSMSLRVDDTQEHVHDFNFSAIGVVDVFGDATTDHESIRNPRPINLGDFLPGTSASAAAAALGGIVNIDLSGIDIAPIEPTLLKGKAQIQLFPPTIEINDTTGKRLTVKMEMMSRYIPDPGTPDVAQFIRGHLRITADVNQVTSQAANVISVNIKSSTAVVTFTPKWSSSPITAEDNARITHLIRNVITTSFLPSTATLATDLKIRFKTTTGSNPSVSILLNMQGAAGDPASFNQSVISGSDGFALAVGAAYVQEVFAPTLTDIRNRPIAPITIPVNVLVHTFHVTYSITLNSATLELKPGKMVLVVKGHAHTGTTIAPDFDFTLRQDLTLSVFGSTATLVVGDFSIDTDDWVANRFKPLIRPRFAAARDAALRDSGAETLVMQAFDADAKLGNMLRSLLSPANPAKPLEPLYFTLPYSSAEIRETGIILHGMINVESWGVPRIEFEPISPTPGTPFDPVSTGPDYSALKTWIPGGTVVRYDWHRGGATGYIDENKFVFLDQGPIVAPPTAYSARLIPGYSQMCLTVYGSQLTAQGPVSSYPLSMTSCGYNVFPFGDLAIASGTSASIALAKRGAGGKVEVVGHAIPVSRTTNAGAPNLLIHFVDESSAETLPDLGRALRESGRTDAATAIVVAARASQIERLPFHDELTYAEDEGAWRRQLGIAPSGSATVVLNPDGKVVWQADGQVKPGELSAALGKVLSKSASSRATMVSANVRIGQRAPNFLFEHSPGQALSLSKLSGREVVVVFFRPASTASIETVRELAGDEKVVIAVTSREIKENRLGSAIVVHDHDNQIAKAYGVSMWPTVFSIDKAGIVRRISYGRPGRGEKNRA